MPKETYYFSHDFGARNDPKLQNVLMEHGAAGLGVFWCIVEQLYEQGGKLPLDFCKTIAFSLHVNTEVVESIVTNFDLFKLDDDCFWSESVNARLKKRNDANESRRQKRLAYVERMKQRQQQDNLHSTTSQLEVNSNSTPTKESKGEEIENKGKDTSANADDSKEIIKEKEVKEEKENSPKKPRVIFKPPTVDEVAAYITERNSPINPTQFWNFYESKGWMIGSNKMKDWKAAVRTWEQKDRKRNGQRNQANQDDSVPPSGFGIILPNGNKYY